jgi:hypothetical protein
VERDVSKNPGLLKLELYCKGMKIDETCNIAEDGAPISRTRGGLGSGLEVTLPDNLYNLIDVYLGLNYKIAFLLTNAEKPKYLISLSCQNGAPLKLTKINKENAIKNQKIESLSSLWNFINKKYGYHVLLFKIDIKMIQNLLDLFFFKFNKLNPFSLLSIMRKFKKSEYIDMFPELPPFKIMKKRNSLVLLKMILDNAIDRFEF